MPAAARRCRCARSPTSSSAPSSVNGVRLMTNVLCGRALTDADLTALLLHLAEGLHEHRPERPRGCPPLPRAEHLPEVLVPALADLDRRVELGHLPSAGRGRCRVHAHGLADRDRGPGGERRVR